MRARDVPGVPRDDDLARARRAALQARRPARAAASTIAVRQAHPDRRRPGRRQLRRRDRAARAEPRCGALGLPRDELAAIGLRAGRRRAVLRPRPRTRSCDGIGEELDAGSTAAPHGLRSRLPARAGADRGNLRGPRIDTIDDRRRK
ncbi:MAG: hypothetical protein MZW92_69025 [Comamonadaceae bacterium]|nr:hypothetical protein [Comamonadaceae bacterium]